jgi:hypothetical protein
MKQKRRRRRNQGNDKVYRVGSEGKMLINDNNNPVLDRNTTSWPLQQMGN